MLVSGMEGGVFRSFFANQHLGIWNDQWDKALRVPRTTHGVRHWMKGGSSAGNPWRVQVAIVVQGGCDCNPLMSPASCSSHSLHQFRTCVAKLRINGLAIHPRNHTIIRKTYTLYQRLRVPSQGTHDHQSLSRLATIYSRVPLISFSKNTSCWKSQALSSWWPDWASNPTFLDKYQSQVLWKQKATKLPT